MRWFHVLGSLKNLTIGLIWLVTRGGGGEAWEGWAREAGKGEMGRGGGTGEQCGSNKGCTKAMISNEDRQKY